MLLITSEKMKSAYMQANYCKAKQEIVAKVVLHIRSSRENLKKTMQDADILLLLLLLLLFFFTLGSI